MSGHSGRLLGVLVILAGCCLGTSSMRIDISPDLVDGIVPRDVTITCGLDVTDDVARSVVVLEVYKDGGKPIAFVRQDNLVHTNTNNDTRIQVEGQIDHNADQSYIRLTIHKARQEDSGTYTCLMYYLDGSGVLKEDRIGGNLTVNEQDMASVVSLLQQQVQHLHQVVGHQNKTIRCQENLIAQMNKTLINHTLQTKTQNKRLTSIETDVSNDHRLLVNTRDSNVALIRGVSEQGNKIRVLEGRINSQQLQVNNNTFVRRIQERRIDVLEVKIQQHETRDPIHCAFSASYNDRDKIEPWQPLLFTNPTINVGHAYNVTSGMFTAPVDGIYVFHLVAMKVMSDGYVYIDLLANSQVVSQLYAQDATHYDQSSMTAVLTLNATDQVWPRVSAIDGQRILYPFHYSQFTGYLLNTLRP